MTDAKDKQIEALMKMVEQQGNQIQQLTDTVQTLQQQPVKQGRPLKDGVGSPQYHAKLVAEDPELLDLTHCRNIMSAIVLDIAINGPRITDQVKIVVSNKQMQLPACAESQVRAEQQQAIHEHTGQVPGGISNVFLSKLLATSLGSLQKPALGEGSLSSSRVSLLLSCLPPVYCGAILHNLHTWAYYNVFQIVDPAEEVMRKQKKQFAQLVACLGLTVDLFFAFDYSFRALCSATYRGLGHVFELNWPGDKSAQEPFTVPPLIMVGFDQCAALFAKQMRAGKGRRSVREVLPLTWFYHTGGIIDCDPNKMRAMHISDLAEVLNHRITAFVPGNLPGLPSTSLSQNVAATGETVGTETDSSDCFTLKHEAGTGDVIESKEELEIGDRLLNRTTNDMNMFWSTQALVDRYEEAQTLAIQYAEGKYQPRLQPNAGELEVNITPGHVLLVAPDAPFKDAFANGGKGRWPIETLWPTYDFSKTFAVNELVKDIQLSWGGNAELKRWLQTEFLVPTKDQRAQFDSMRHRIELEICWHGILSAARTHDMHTSDEMPPQWSEQGIEAFVNAMVKNTLEKFQHPCADIPEFKNWFEKLYPIRTLKDELRTMFKLIVDFCDYLIEYNDKEKRALNTMLFMFQTYAAIHQEKSHG